ncbi:helix-turn-helix domain-containing protein [Streptomyces sp. NPDC001478]
MATRKEIDGAAGVPQFYGKELRFQREQAGLTLERLVEGSFFGVTYLSEIEHGHRRMPVELARHVDRVLQTDGFFERRCEDVRKARQGAHAAYFAQVTEAETRACAIHEWSGTLIPGLLQTRAYAKALISSAHPLDTPEEVNAKLDSRLKRAKLFSNRKRPEYWVVLHESLVKQPLLPPAEMAEQLDHIVSLAMSGRIVVQILPWNGPTLALADIPLFIMDFNDEPPLVYTEGPYHGQTIDDPALVALYRKAYDRLRAAALPPEASLTLIKHAAEEYRNGQQPS